MTLIILAILVASGVYHFWHKNHQPTTAERYKTESVTYGNITQTVSANGTLNPVVLVNVGTQVSGTVKKLYADFNDRVKEGEVLVELDDSLFQAQVKQSQANVSGAEASLAICGATRSPRSPSTMPSR